MTPGRPHSTATTDLGPSAPGSVDNALRILQLLESRATVRVADVAREVGIAKSTAHRLLAMLEYHRFVRQVDAQRAYAAGSALLQVGLRTHRTFDLRSAARPHLEGLRDRTNESCGLLVLDRTEAVMIDFVSGSNPVRVVDRVGDRLPAHLTAAGKAMLANLRSDDIVQLYPKNKLEAFTSNSIRTRAQLVEVLDDVRKDGFAINFEESGLGIYGVAAPVADPDGIVVGAITLVLPASGANGEALRRLGPMVRDTAERISRSSREGTGAP